MKTVAFLSTITAATLLLGACTAKDGTVSFSESTDQNKRLSGGDTPFDRSMRAADIGYRTGDYAAVEAAYSKAVKESELLDAADPRRSLAVWKLATACQEQGKYKEAQPLFEKALQIDRDILGTTLTSRSETTTSSNRPTDKTTKDVIRDLGFLAINLQTQGNFAAAEPLWKEAVELQEQLWPNAAETAVTHAEFARNLLRQKKAAAAQSQVMRAVEIDEKLFGKEHLNVSQDLVLLAEIYEAQKNAADEEACYKRVLAIQEKLLGQKNVQFIQFKQKYANFLRSHKRDAEALKIEQSIAATTKSAGKQTAPADSKDSAH